MIFDFFKRIFGIVDEQSRKRHATDTDNDCIREIGSAKKHCCSREGIRMGRVLYVDENDDDEIQFLSESNCSPVRSKERVNGVSSTRRKVAGLQYPEQTLRNDISSSQMNGSLTRCKSFQTRRSNIMSSTNLKASTLEKTNQWREKQEYSRLLQRFLPQRFNDTQHKSREDNAKRQPIPEVIDLETTEFASRIETEDPENASASEVRAVFTTPPTSPLEKWYTPREPRKFESTRPKFNDEPIFLAKKTHNRAKNDEISILKVREKSTRIPLSITREKSKSTVENVPKSPDTSGPSTSRRSSRNCIEIIHTNTLRDNLASKAVMKQDFVPRISSQYNEKWEQRNRDAEELKKLTVLLSKHNRLSREAALETQLSRSMRLCEAVLDDTEEPEEEPLPELTPPMLQDIKQALIPSPPSQVLAENFGLRVTRKDIHTLSGLNWLNDEVINFYMNLLIVRGTSDGKFPKVYAMNTFFYPKLSTSGYSSLKRWTRKIDIFAQDIIVVPIHLGMHWCMSIIDFRDKSIRYYDSMGGANPKCLVALRRYLVDESMDKKKTAYDTSDWKLESMMDIPQQMNGSDCGVFSCMFAEFITANRKITFTQDDMPYFRKKMVYEIIKSKLL